MRHFIRLIAPVGTFPITVQVLGYGPSLFRPRGCSFIWFYHDPATLQAKKPHCLFAWAESKYPNTLKAQEGQ